MQLSLLMLVLVGWRATTAVVAGLCTKRIMPVTTRAASAASFSPATTTTTTRLMATTKSSHKRADSETSDDSDSKMKKKARKAADKATEKKPAKKQLSDESDNDPDRPWYHVFTKGDKEYDEYMATEWSYEQRGDQALFEKLSLEGAQSGLSWLTILRKRQAYRSAFFQFDPHRVAQMTDADVERLLTMEDKDNPRNLVVRHRGKIQAVINNAQCLLQMQKDEKSEAALDRFLWSFVQDQPILNHFGLRSSSDTLQQQMQDFPTQTAESQAMSKALKKRGWKFVGPTTCYALMQAVGMVIDHPVDTPEWRAAQQRLEQRLGGYQNRQPLAATTEKDDETDSS